MRKGPIPVFLLVVWVLLAYGCSGVPVSTPEQERQRITEARSLNLPDSAVWGDIGYERRRRHAIALGLSADAPVYEIEDRELTRKYGLPDSATREQIKVLREEENKKKRAKKVRLPLTATLDEIRIRERELEAEEWKRERARNSPKKPQYIHETVRIQIGVGIRSK